MKWTLNEPVRGDVVRVKLGNIYHFGIYVSDDEIIQFGLPPTNLQRDASTVEVCSTNLETFLCGKFLEVGVPEKKENKKILPKEKIVEAARARLGERGYHIIYNNCEHFAFQCAFKEKVCNQIEEVRELFRSYPFVNVFVKKFPFQTKNNEIYPSQRQQEIENCGNVNVKEEKFYAWKLLEHAALQSLGLEIKNVKFINDHGKWSCDKFHFSISHSENLVAVAIARNPVGVDIEEINLQRFSKIPIGRILTKEELAQNEYNEQDLNCLWAVKEAVFKKSNLKAFNPCKVSTVNEKYKSLILQNDGNQFALAVVTNDLPFVKFYLDEDIVKIN